MHAKDLPSVHMSTNFGVDSSSHFPLKHGHTERQTDRHIHTYTHGSASTTSLGNVIIAGLVCVCVCVCVK